MNDDQNKKAQNPQGAGTSIPPPSPLPQAPLGGMPQQAPFGGGMYPPPPPPYDMGGQFGGPQPGFGPGFGGPGQYGSPYQPIPEDTSPANFQLGKLLPATLNVPVPKHNLNFNEPNFIRLLAGSISLHKDEKIRIIDSIPKLRQQQVDELTRIFEEEKKKFAELPKKHVAQLDKLAKKHFEDWMDIEMHYQKASRKAEDNVKADEIRKKLGL